MLKPKRRVALSANALFLRRAGTDADARNYRHSLSASFFRSCVDRRANSPGAGMDRGFDGLFAKDGEDLRIGHFGVS
jgi:hypothetical protein